MKESYRLNTSNPGKLKEYQSFFEKHGLRLDVSGIDLVEIDADPLTVIIHKASQIDDGVLVDDTSLEIEDCDIGVNIKWLLDDLDKNLGRKAVWTVFLARRQNDNVYIYSGKVAGRIVLPRNRGGFGFDPYFLPEAAAKTLSEDKPDCNNARALAVKNLVEEKPFAIRSPIYHWEGPWQNKHT